MTKIVKTRIRNLLAGVATAGALVIGPACGSDGGSNDAQGEPDGDADDDWKCGTHSSAPGLCRCDTPIEKAGRTPTLDCNDDDYVCCTYSKSSDSSSCSCLTATRLAEQGYADCEAIAHEFSTTVIDSCPP
jgi:hypothetical protein